MSNTFTEKYTELKERNQNYLLMIRLGDFYEIFGDDAVVTANELNLTITTRADVKMCGVPYHTAGEYIAHLRYKGFRVAVADSVKGEYKVTQRFYADDANWTAENIQNALAGKPDRFDTPHT